MNIMDSNLLLNLPPISRQIWEMKYRLQDKAGIAEPYLEQTFRRVADAVALAEIPERRAERSGQFFDLMQSLKFLPAGRVLAGAGTGRAVTLFNCFVMDKIADSIPGIFRGLSEAAQTLQQGGGIGHDFSTLRPLNAPVHGVGADASGPLSFMDVWDAMCRTIMSAGARRGAMMGTLRCDHPDIEAFIAAKRNPARLRNFNLSVLVTDQFMAAVKADDIWPLLFAGQVFKTLKARDLWQQIMRATYDYAEPGVIFIDRINSLNPLSYCEEISSTNPCGEQPLPPYGACLLGSLNLTRFVRGAFTPGASIDLEQIKSATQTAIRFLDDVIDVSNYPLPQQKQEALAKRRLGLGVTGLADGLVMCGLRYGSAAAADIAATVLQTMRDAALEASMALAQEKGVFPLFETEAYLATVYAQTLSVAQRSNIRRHGLRNGLLTSIAPTGTISLLAGNVSSGIEPVFNAGYERKIMAADKSTRSEWLSDYAVALWQIQAGKENSLPPAFVSVDDLTPGDHLTMAAAVQPYIDSSISKTVNVPVTCNFAPFVGIYEQAYAMGLKGCTTFRPNAITGSILQASPDTCPSCGSESLVAKEGCKSCLSCGFAVCG